MTHTIFKLVYFIELVVITLVRRAALRRTAAFLQPLNTTSVLDRLLLYLSSFANLMPLVYVFTSWLDFANYDLPAWIGWLGALIFAGSGSTDLEDPQGSGPQLDPFPGFRDGHYLVTDGIFEYLRHPMYAAHLLWGLAQMLMLHNWIAGFAYLVVIIPRTLVRIQNEEKIMLEKFGDEYAEYTEKTGGLIPRLE